MLDIELDKKLKIVIQEVKDFINNKISEAISQNISDFVSNKVGEKVTDNDSHKVTDIVTKESCRKARIKKHIDGWSIQFDGKYYKAFKRFGNKLKSIHLGKKESVTNELISEIIKKKTQERNL